MPHKMMNSQIADVLHDNRLSIEARMLYAYLCSFDDTSLRGLRIRSRHLKTVLIHNIRQMSMVAFSTVHVRCLTTVISMSIR